MKYTKLLTIADKIIRSYIEKKAEDLICTKQEDYLIETTNYGYYHNGVGFASCGGRQNVYDEDRAFNDALEIVQEETDNISEDFYYQFAKNKEFVEILNDILETYRR